MWDESGSPRQAGITDAGYSCAYKMRNRCLLMLILALASSVMLATSTFAAEAGATEHEGVSLKPQMLVQFGGFGITNSMLVTWIVAAGIIIFS
ncbi:MAG: hypothetical protein DME93_02745, partial [Verrucomicrobia bacterium]